MIYIILPAYNEETALAALLARIKSTMETALFKYEVIVVNDGSTDKTLEIAQKQSSVIPLRIVDHGCNKGLGEAWKSGLVMASRIAHDEDIIVTMDADNTHSPDLIPHMASKIEQGHDVVIASRHVRGAREVGLSFYRRLLSKASSLCFRFCFPMEGVKDYSCGFRAYRAATIQKAVGTYGTMFVEETGFTCIADVLLKLRKLKIRVCEVPLVLRYDYKDGASKMRVFRTIRRSLMLIISSLFVPGNKPFRNIRIS